MVNYSFLVIIFLFMAIEAVSTYKFFKLKKIKLGIFSLVYFFVTLILTLSYFSSRDVLVENEVESLINGITNFNLFAILSNLPIIFYSTFYLISLTFLQGLPYAIELSGMSFVTTLPAPIVTLLPIVTPGSTTTFPPNHTLLPTLIGFTYSKPLFLKSISIGCPAV